jgi:hypothetical protein
MEKNMRKNRGLLWPHVGLFCALLLPGGPARAQPASPPARTMTAADRTALINLVEELVKTRPLRGATLGSKLGVQLAKDVPASNPYFNIYQSPKGAPASGAIRSAELREPTNAPAEGPVGSLLNLEISPALGIKVDDIRRRFGAEPEPVFPSAHAPADTPMYWVYKKDWGNLSFGFSREPERLVRVIIDGIKPRS